MVLYTLIFIIEKPGVGIYAHNANISKAEAGESEVQGHPFTAK